MGKRIPVVDLFAGAGGFGEGFASFRNHSERPVFDVCFSVEKDFSAHATLLLRKFFRNFPCGEAPEAYYECIKGNISTQQLYSLFQSEYKAAFRAVWLAELGAEADLNDRVSQQIRDVLIDTDHWVLTGGPPCQTFSMASRRRRTKRGEAIPENDPRTFLYKEYIRVIAEHCPSVFVLENVKGLISSRVKDQSLFESMLDQLRNPPNYGTAKKHLQYGLFPLTIQKNHKIFEEASKPEDFIVESEYYGIPQRRHRVIILGIRSDLIPAHMTRLEPEHTVPLDEILKSLPALRSGLSREKDTPQTWKDAIAAVTRSEWFRNMSHGQRSSIASRIENVAGMQATPVHDRGGEFVPCDWRMNNGFDSWYKDIRLGGVIQHVSRSHMVPDLHRYLFAACFAADTGTSPSLSSFPEGLLPNHKNAKGKEFSDRFRVQVFGKPSSTIMSHIGKDGHYYIHPDPFQCRSLTVREAARLQTFPDNFYFCGTNTSRFAQIGNAVPPLLASKIARIVAQILGIDK